jgi:hypothetical protein
MKTLTAFQLIKKLQKICESGPGGKRLPVCATAQSLLEDSNGVFQIADIRTVEVESVPQCDGDGFFEFRKDGTEKTRRCIVLS